MIHYIPTGMRFNDALKTFKIKDGDFLFQCGTVGGIEEMVSVRVNEVPADDQGNTWLEPIYIGAFRVSKPRYAKGGILEKENLETTASKWLFKPPVGIYREMRDSMTIDYLKARNLL